MNQKPKVGLLPLYLALYDRVRPEFRAQVEGFARLVAERLASGGLQVESAGVCCVRSEIERAVTDLRARDVDLIATLHVAYSPSLEAVEPVAAAGLPLVLLDTTPAKRFGVDATMDDMFANHGIHGVQDLASVLRRRGRTYSLVVGHIDDESFLREAVEAARAARAARCMRSMSVLVFGDEFPGMGDFAVEPTAMLEGLGVTMDRVAVESLAERLSAVTDDELAAEATEDLRRFDCSAVSEAALATSNRVGLALRQMVEERSAGAFSFNFQSFTRARGVPTVPFLEASKAMARGVGYAGEGDALTAALVGALLRGFGEVTFTEMFCPDWEGNAIFMSHMGECNPALAAERPRLVEKDYAFGDAENPIMAQFPMRSGPATLVNMAPGPGDSFGILAARVRVLDRHADENFRDVPHFWVEPAQGEVRDLLRRYSEKGGTHHLALVHGEVVEAIRRMAEMLGLEFAEI